ncbi:hypothetical protein SteCoe_16014 [Stentor coeruleus]|uniref:Uncharacterized protein n=1 Tax=Stentor coeruleus TaxID=5963 RepID=A0A1R2C2F6_9CILI|nr:hypothetical protein SteCoe_16014 [Stentor coeruleus]
MNRSHFRPTRLADPTEITGYHKMIKDLESKLDLSSESPLQNSSLIIPKHPSPNKQKYAEELKQQILQQAKQKHQQKIDLQKPGISENFYGYPNLPQTPKKIRRLREVEQMKKVRESLTLQMQDKKTSSEEFKSKIIEYDKLLNEKDIQGMYDEQAEKIRKKEKEREILIKSWDLATKTHDLKKKIEETEKKGNSPLRYEGYDENLSVTASRVIKEDVDGNEESEDVVSKAYEEKGVRIGKLELKKKAQALRDSIEDKIRSSYQYKIKKILEQAKNIREMQRNQFNNSQAGSVSKRFPSPF